MERGESVLDLNPPAECVNKKVLPNKFALSTVIICHYDNMLCPPCGQKKISNSSFLSAK